MQILIYLKIFLTLHKSIQFTTEFEINCSLTFFEILINRRLYYNNSWFITNIHRKPTYNGLILKWDFMVPIEYKRGVISSMLYRAVRINSDFSLLHKEFIFVRQIAMSNGYPSFLLFLILFDEL